MTAKKKAAHAIPPDADAQAPQAQDGPQAAQPPAPAAAAPAAGADAAVADAKAPSPAQAPARDEHAGRGGLYRRNADGTRSLIARTQRAAG